MALHQGEKNLLVEMYHNRLTGGYPVKDSDGSSGAAKTLSWMKLVTTYYDSANATMCAQLTPVGKLTAKKLIDEQNHKDLVEEMQRMGVDNALSNIAQALNRLTGHLPDKTSVDLALTDLEDAIINIREAYDIDPKI